MKILAINAGSSSLKFQLIEDEKEIMKGLFEKIGHDDSFYTIDGNQEKQLIKDHQTAALILIEKLKEKVDLTNITAVGHRVVHGGDKYQNAVLIDEQVINDIEKFQSLAPLHNPVNLLVIKLLSKYFKNMVAVFDTAFHQTIEKTQYIYPVPYEWYQKHQVRKYGFHGISHQYLMQKVTEINPNLKKIIICHLGNGCSITAINNQKSVETSMGFTPNAGLMMGTRAGDIDFNIIPYMMEKTNQSLSETINDLNKKSGLLGLSNISNDFREIPKDSIAYQKFMQIIVDYIAKYYVFLNGAEAIVFSGGIGENAQQLRQDICEKLKILDIEIAENKNQNNELIIHQTNSNTEIYVIPTNEEVLIYQETKKIIERENYESN